MDAPLEALFCRLSKGYKEQYTRMMQQRDALRLGGYYHTFKRFLKARIFEQAEFWAKKMQEIAPDLPAGWIAMTRLYNEFNRKNEAMKAATEMMRKLQKIPASIRRGLNSTCYHLRQQAQLLKAQKPLTPWEKFYKQVESSASAW